MEERGDPNEPIRKARKRFLSGCALVVLSPLVFIYGTVSLMWEGPHVPEGEIKGDPSAPYIFWTGTVVALVILVLGLRIIYKSIRR